MTPKKAQHAILVKAQMMNINIFTKRKNQELSGKSPNRFDKNQVQFGSSDDSDEFDDEDDELVKIVREKAEFLP